jgi:putative restriction endonuclease
MDLIAHDIIRNNIIEFNADLLDVFELYWYRIMGPEKPSNPVLPFFHLHRDGFWHLIPVPGNEQALIRIEQIRSIGALRQLVQGATLDNALFEILLNEEARDELRRILIETHFASEVHPQLVEIGQITAESFQYGLELMGRPQQRFRLKVSESPEGRDPYHAVSRSTAFRRVVVKAYDYTCAMCRIRVFTPEGRAVVVAAHIVPWSESHNDDPRNGLALCGLHHWVFDQGLVGVARDYRIQVSPVIPTDAEGTKPLWLLAENELHLPGDHTLRPAKTALRWHRKNVFCDSAPARLL